MGRDYDPVAGQWFEDLEEEELFLVLAVDPDEELVKIQYENGDIEEIDLDTWHVLDLEKTTQPDGWSGSVADDEDDEADIAERGFIGVHLAFAGRGGVYK